MKTAGNRFSVLTMATKIRSARSLEADAGGTHHVFSDTWILVHDLHSHLDSKRRSQKMKATDLACSHGTPQASKNDQM